MALYFVLQCKKIPRAGGGRSFTTFTEGEGLVVFFVVQLNRCLILIWLQRQQVAAQMVNHLLGGIAEEGRR